MDELVPMLRHVLGRHNDDGVPVVELVRRLAEGYDLLAEAVEAERALREHQEECNWAQMDKPGACLDKSCMRLAEARDKAFEVALVHLRGVGCD